MLVILYQCLDASSSKWVSIYGISSRLRTYSRTLPHLLWISSFMHAGSVLFRQKENFIRYHRSTTVCVNLPWSAYIEIFTRGKWVDARKFIYNLVRTRRASPGLHSVNFLLHAGPASMPAVAQNRTSRIIYHRLNTTTSPFVPQWCLISNKQAIPRPAYIKGFTQGRGGNTRTSLRVNSRGLL